LNILQLRLNFQPRAGERRKEICLILGVGRDAFQEFDFLQNAPGAFGHGAHGIVGQVDRQAGFLGDEPVNSAQQ
jgi:hypothetical protein